MDGGLGHWKSADSKARSVATAMRNIEDGRDKRWRGKLGVGERCDTLVRLLFTILNKEKTSMSDLARRVGVRVGTISDWRNRRASPNLFLLRACFNALDYEIIAVKKHYHDGRARARNGSVVSPNTFP